MKGVILNCVEELVRTKFGGDSWVEALKKANLPADTSFLMTEDVPDDKIFTILKGICDTLHLTLGQVADAFGEYWVGTFAPRLYRKYYAEAKNAMDFLLLMDRAHYETTISMQGAQPPRFDYRWKDDKTLIMGYRSHRRLIDFMISLIKGVGKYYKEDLKITKLSETEVEVVFPYPKK